MNIAPKVKSIIEEMGFKLVGNEYIADFIEDNCGEIISIIVKNDSDESGVPQMQFHAFDANGNFLGKQTLDQMLYSRYNNLQLIKKPNSKFATTYKLQIQVPIDMRQMTEERYMELMKDSDSPDSFRIAELAGRNELNNFLKYCPFNVTLIDIGDTEEIKE